MELYFGSSILESRYLVSLDLSLYKRSFPETPFPETFGQTSIHVTLMTVMESFKTISYLLNYVYFSN